MRGRGGRGGEGTRERRGGEVRGAEEARGMGGGDSGEKRRVRWGGEGTRERRGGEVRVRRGGEGKGQEGGKGRNQQVKV